MQKNIPTVPHSTSIDNDVHNLQGSFFINSKVDSGSLNAWLLFSEPFHYQNQEGSNNRVQNSVTIVDLHIECLQKIDPWIDLMSNSTVKKKMDF